MMAGDRHTGPSAVPPLPRPWHRRIAGSPSVQRARVGLRSATTPVAWFALAVRDCDDQNHLWIDLVDDLVRKAPEQKSTRPVQVRRPGLRRSFNSRERFGEFILESACDALVPLEIPRCRSDGLRDCCRQNLKSPGHDLVHESEQGPRRQQGRRPLHVRTLQFGLGAPRSTRILDQLRPRPHPDLRATRPQALLGSRREGGVLRQ